MSLFRKKDTALAMQDIMAKLGELRGKADLLVFKATDENIRGRLLRIADTIRYLAPSKKAEIMQIDDKMDNKLDDLKILLLTRNDLFRIKNILDELDVLLLERKNKY